MSAKSQGEEEERQSNSQQGFKRPLSQDSSGSVSSNSDQSRSPLPLPPSKRRKTRGSSSSGDVSVDTPCSFSVHAILIWFYISLIPRPSYCPVFDHLQYAKTEGN